MGSDGGTDLLEHPDTEPFKLLILVEDRLNALDFDGTVQVLLEFFLDHPRQGLIVRLKFLVMREDLGPQMIDLHRTLVRFSNDGITDVQRKRFVMEDSPGVKKMKSRMAATIRSYCHVPRAYLQNRAFLRTKKILWNIAGSLMKTF